MARPLADVLQETHRKPSDLLAEQVKRYRDERGWSQRKLCEVLADRFGVTFDPATMARLEGKERRITVDEAAMFAVALNVPLVTLLWPIGETEAVSVAPGLTVLPWQAIEWSVGNDQLPGLDVGEYEASQSQLIALGQLIVAALNAADTKHLKGKYTELLSELANRLFDARGKGVATEGTIPDEVQLDLDKAFPQAPMHTARVTRGGDS